MFLSVPARVGHMEPNDAQRADLAGRIRAARTRRYMGSRKAAYTAADVNSATWARAEDGEPLAERSLVRIVLTLWPETGGDWTQLDPPLGGGDIEAEVEASNLSEATKAYIRRQLAEDRTADDGKGHNHGA